MTQALVNKTCTIKVRRAAEIEPCGSTLKFIKDRGQVCPDKEMHLNPIPTGFCHSGWHEGQKINKPTCKFWINCPCDCHTRISMMMVLTDTERLLQDNSTWAAPQLFVMIRASDVAVEKAVQQERARVVASTVPSLVPDRVERIFAPTESGRAARGELESMVREIVDAWSMEPFVNCTPQYVSERIYQAFGEKKSTGAIDAVFRRWQVIGFANVGIKPTRIISYTPLGIQQGLEALKAKAKRP